MCCTIITGKNIAYWMATLELVFCTNYGQKHCIHWMASFMPYRRLREYRSETESKIGSNARALAVRDISPIWLSERTFGNRAVG